MTTTGAEGSEDADVGEDEEEEDDTEEAMAGNDRRLPLRRGRL